MNPDFDWLVIGAGPAGIAAVGSLLDHNVAPHQVGWLDPAFQVGDLGAKWRHVSSNTKVALFLRFLQGCRAFEFAKRETPFPLERASPHENCLLQEVVTPLQWVTARLKAQVKAIQGEAVTLDLRHGAWEIHTKTTSLRAKQVILATGAEPRVLSYPHATAVPLEVALDPSQLATAIQPHDIVGVFGSSHSAVLVLAHLARLAPRQVYNFYRSPHLYAVDMGDWILFDNTGLKGLAAQWARQHLDGTPPPHLQRCLLSDSTFQEKLAQCTKVIYAVGFERRKLPVIVPFPHAGYHETVGVIAPGLFGVGIAYPQAQFDPLGNREHRVGLWKFMDYLNTVMPIWLKA